MATKFQIKRTSVSGRTPNTTNSANSSYIAAGELALNLTDKKMYSSNGTNYFEIGAFNVQLVNSTSNVSTYTQISTLQFDEDSGFDITNPSTGIAKVAMNSTFKYWQVDGVQKLTATGLDTVNFIAGNNITITANGANTPQSIAFSTSLTPTFTSATFGNSTVNTVANSTSITTKQIYANGIFGSNGQILTSNGTGIYWSNSTERDPQVINNLFVANGSNTQFTLTASSNTLNTFVTLNGVTQRPTTDYTVSGTTLTFTTAPALNDNISVTIIDVPNLLDVEFAQDRFTGNGSNTQYTLSTTVTGNTFTFVSVGGVTQVPTTDYSISGATLTFTTAPALNDQVEVISVDPIDNFIATAYVANGTATTFGLPHNSSTGSTFVFLNGVSQTPFADFYVSSNTVIFTAAPAANDVILIRSFYKPLSASGPNTSILYNKSGLIGGTLGFTFNESTNNVTIGNTLITPNFTLSASNPPANSTATGSTGTFAWDSSYFYIATGTNTWKKVPITTDGVVGSAVTAGSNTEIQFNDSGALGANSNFTFNKTSGLLTVGNSTVNTTVNSSAIVATKIVANGAFGSNGQVLTSNGTAMYWGVGGGGAVSGVGITRESFTGNGSNTIFTLSTEPIDETHLMVYVDRVIQRDADYNVSGTTLSFVTAPDNGAEIDAYIMTDSSQQPKGVKVNSFTGNGSNTQFTLGAASSNSAYTLVFVDTIFQPTTEYTIAGTLITFNTAPDNAVPIEVIQLGTGLVGDPQVAGANSEIQFNSSNSFGANNKFTFNPTTTTLALGSNVTINTSAIFIGNSTVNTTIIAGNVDLQGTQLRVGNVVVNGNQITIGNSTVNSVINSTGVALAGDATFSGDLMPAANITYDIGNSTMRWKDLWLSGTTINLGGASIKTDTDTGAVAIIPKPTVANPDPVAMVVSPTGGITTVPTTGGVPAANAVAEAAESNTAAPVPIDITTTAPANGHMLVWSSDTNTFIPSNGVVAHTSGLTIGNSTVNTVVNSTAVVATNLSGNGSQLTSVDATTLGGNTASTLRSYSDTVAATAFSNAAARADSAYSNAVAYAASNSYVNTTFLPFTGGTLTGNLTVNATANIVSNLSANNVTFRGDVQIDGNLTVSGTSVVINATSLAVEDNMIYLNNGSQVSHPDLGFAGNYNDGSYKHAGFFRDATDGVWKLFDGYTPEPDASAYIDTSNASFRIADFTANVITANSFSGNGSSITSVNAATVGGNTASTLRTYSDTVAATAFSNAATRADSAYSNAVAYANTTFLPLAGGTLTGTLTVKAISSNGSVGTAGQLLASNGTSTYWIDPPASTNVNAQYVWTNTHTFANTITFGNSTVNSTISSTSLNVGGTLSFDGNNLSLAGAATPRLRANMSGATSSRFVIQNSTTDGNSRYYVIPNGTGTISAVSFFNNSDISTNYSTMDIGTIASIDNRFTSANSGTGTLLPFTFRMNSTEIVRFDTNGNVGIGTPSPAGMLDVSSSATLNNTYFRVTSNTTSSYVQHYFLANTAFIRMGVTAPAYTGWSGDAWIYASRGLVLSANDGAGYTYYAANGNVGVGTMSPDTKLQVNGIITSNASGTGTHYLGYTSGSSRVAARITGVESPSYNATGKIGFSVTTWGAGTDYGLTEVMAIDMRGADSKNPTIWMNPFGGNVGIGNTSPADILSVHSSSADSYIRMNSSNVGNTGIKISYNGSSTHGIDLFYYPNNAQCYFDSKYQVNAGTVYGDIYFRQNVAGTMTTRMTIKADGGSVIVAGTLTENSSITLKENVNPITNAIDTISKLVGVTYDRKDGSAIQRPGLIAEEVDKILPNIVIKDENGAPSSIAYTNLIAYLIESIKELKQEIDILKGK